MNKSERTHIKKHCVAGVELYHDVENDFSTLINKIQELRAQINTLYYKDKDNAQRLSNLCELGQDLFNYVINMGSGLVMMRDAFEEIGVIAGVDIFEPNNDQFELINDQEEN